MRWTKTKRDQRILATYNMEYVKVVGSSEDAEWLGHWDYEKKETENSMCRSEDKLQAELQASTNHHRTHHQSVASLANTLGQDASPHG